MKAQRLFPIIIMILLSQASNVTAADVKNGSNIYARNCASCHADDGRGSVPNAPNFKFQESLVKPDQQLFKAISVGKGMMPAYRGILTEREILDVIAYLRTFY